ncbi:MAG: helix-turn-helix domain-containing protein [Elusimicrobia bacterium]|nr:helix-turn-helix domain-containing protein [Elusimicrobiota bacterium]
MKQYGFLTIKEIASILKLDVMTIYRYVKQGKLVAGKFDKEFRVSKQDFEKFLKQAYQAASKSNKAHRSCLGKKAQKTPKMAK